MKILRTPDERFKNIPGYPFAANYVDDLPSCPGIRIHYVDEGPRQAREIFLCLHGEPTWSYLYRKMIPIFAGRGCRVIAPDLVGFGKSDKVTERSYYTFENHRQMLLDFIRRLDLNSITLVCQDWGGLLGLTLPMEMPERFSRLLVMNTALGTGESRVHLAFRLWRAYVRFSPNLNIGRIMKFSEPRLSEAEVAAYEAPFPDKRYKWGAKIFPSIVPTRFDDPGADISRRARDWWRDQWNGPTFMAVGSKDPVLGPPVMARLRRVIRGCPEPFLMNAGHFVQERGEVVAEKALEHFGL